MAKKSKYIKIYKDILARIISEQFPGKRIPSIRQIAKDYNVSLMTANKAVKELEKNGIVKCGVGSVGTVIDEKLAASNYSNISSNCIWTDLENLSGKDKLIRFNCKDYNQDNEKMWTELIDMFSSIYPWINVEITSNFHEEKNFSNTSYDVIQLSGRDTKDYSAQALVWDISNLVKKIVVKEDFIDNILNTCCWEGSYFALPTAVNTPVVYYNKKNMGNFVADWQTYFNAIKKTVAEGKYTGLNLGLVSLIYYFVGEISNFLQDDLDREAMEKLLNILKYVTLSGPSELALQHDNIIKAFINEEIDFFCSYSSSIGLLSQECDFAWGISPMPLEETGVPISETVVNGISPSSKNKKEAWRFIKFLSSTDAQKVFARQRKYIPVNKVAFDEVYAIQDSNSSELLRQNIEKSASGIICSQDLYSLYKSVTPLLENYYSDNKQKSNIIEKIIFYVKEVLLLDQEL